MTQTPSAREGRRDLLWLALGAAILFLPLLGARDLWNPNEPVYGRAVVEMQQRADWLVPTVNGEVFFEKPILYYWLARLSALLVGGVGAFSLRLPSAAAGVLCVLLVYLLVLPAGGRFRAQLAGAMLATTFAVFWSSRWIQMDLLLAASTLAALVAATRVLDHGASSRRGWTLFGLAAGVGLLAKGPLGLICPGVVLFLYAAATRRLGVLLRQASPLAGAAVVLVVAPWIVLLWFHGESGGWFEAVYRQNVTRFLDPWDHQAPWWYFMVFFWSDMAPWSFFLPFAAGLPGRDVPQRRLDLLAWLWIAGLMTLFSLSASKRSIYLLPAAPAVAILVSGVAERFVIGTLSRKRRQAAQLVLGLFGGLLVGAGGYIQLQAIEQYPLLEAPGRAAAILLVAGGLAVFIGLFTRARTHLAAPAALFALTVSLYLLTAVWVLPRANVYKSARPFCNEVTELVSPDRELRAFRPWKWRAAYSYYTDRNIPRLTTPGELVEYWSRPDRVFVIVERSERIPFLSIVGPQTPLLSRAIGSNQVFLFSNHPTGRSEAVP